MERRTYSELLTEVQLELDLQEETIISDNEFVQYCNDSIQEAESIILGMRQDYFLTSKKLYNGVTYGLKAGQNLYPLPTDMFATKIREVVYSNGSDIFDIRPFQYGRKLSEIELLERDNPSPQSFYNYIIVNNNVYDPTLPNTTNFQMRIIPTPKETGDYVTIWYLREAAKIPYTSNSTVQVDIPEFYWFIKARFKLLCALKEMHPKLEALAAEYERQKQLMIRALKTRYEDENNEIRQDVSFYEECTGGGR